MKVKELRQILSGLPGDMETDVEVVTISSDRAIFDYSNPLDSPSKPPSATLTLGSGDRLTIGLDEDPSDGTVSIVVLDDDGGIASQGFLATLTCDGEMRLAGNVNAGFGLHLTTRRRSIVTTSGSL